MRARQFAPLSMIIVIITASHLHAVQASPECPNVLWQGLSNQATSAVTCATVSGGRENRATQNFATVSGGYLNTATNIYATVSGGSANDATERWATVGGGFFNEARAPFATVSGGGSSDTTNASATANTVSDSYGTVGGGGDNLADDNTGTNEDTPYATVGGGRSNNASGKYSLVAGGDSNRAEAYTATVGGGYNNKVYGGYATISGGDLNEAKALSATVGGGSNNITSGAASYATISGGYINRASANFTTIGGGGQNTASGNYSTVAGGRENLARGGQDTIGGGYRNVVSGGYATVPGGYFNTASGLISFAAGRQAKALHAGTFVWGDNTAADLSSTANNQFIARASGGVTFFSNQAANSGVRLAPGAGAWSTLSDRNMKANLADVDSSSILERVAAMPIQRWNYTSQDASVKHIGPMAQDFAAAFGVGENNTTISTVDADGVALAAIQGLYQKNIALGQQIATLKARVDAEPVMSSGLQIAPTGLRLTVSWGVVTLGVLSVILLLIVSSVSLTLLVLRRRTMPA